MSQKQLKRALSQSKRARKELRKINDVRPLPVEIVGEFLEAQKSLLKTEGELLKLLDQPKPGA